MTEKQLIQMGFKKEKLNEDYWYELPYKQHKFITNDTLNNEGKDTWFIGYQCGGSYEVFWFNEKLSEEGVFKVVFNLLTGTEFKLANQRKIFSKK